MNLPKEAEAHLQAQMSGLSSELRSVFSAAVELELQRAAGVDVTIGEAALRASMASIALEKAVHIERTALRMILAAIAATA